MPEPTPTQNFIKEIKNRLINGIGFTPFLGSGISAQSGILMSQEFADYLAYSVYKVIRKPDRDEQCWDIRVNGWPPQPDTDELNETYRYLADVYKSLGGLYDFYFSPSNVDRNQKIEHVHALTPKGYQEHDPARDIHMLRPLVPEILRHDNFWETESELDWNRRSLGVEDLPTNRNNSASSWTYLEDKAIRALSHWTTTLEFLASVKVIYSRNDQIHCQSDRNAENMGQPVMTSIDSTVIDNFNAHITKGKRPNLIHNMIARLARSLRTHLILTTNFDELIEASYRDQGEPLLPIPVSIKGGLPGFATVRAQDSLVKLHGDMQETRADSSINHPPSEQDKLNFYHYLRGPQTPNESPHRDFCQNDLLVLGYSASDARCVEMIKAVLDFDREFCVFWVCYNAGDVRKIRKLFKEYLDRTKKQIFILETDRPDLFLWELYQQVNLALPGGGSTVHFSHHVPPVPFHNVKGLSNKELDELFAQYSKRLHLTPPKNHQTGMMKSGKSIVVEDLPSGAATKMTNLYYAFQREKYEAIWLELEDYASPFDLLFQILLTFSIKKGYFQMDWVNLIPNDKDSAALGVDNPLIERIWLDRLNLLEHKFRLDPSRCVIFLYGRNGLGGCSGWRFQYWDKAKEEQFGQMLKILETSGYSIIAMLNGKNRKERNKAKATDIDQLLQRHSDRFLSQSSKKEGKSEFLDYSDFSRFYYSKCQEDGLAPSNADSQEEEQVPNSPFNPVLMPESDVYATAKAHCSPIVGSSDSLSPTPSSRYESVLFSVINSFFADPQTTKKSKDGKDTNRIRARRMIWLYGLTLFRQSRHPAALISEAVFPCPYQFNAESRDNDEGRYEIIFEGGHENGILEGYSGPEIAPEKEGWLNWLANIGLFLRKPGGYAWQYRDTRLGIQYLIERHAGISLPGHLKSKSFPLWRMRGRLHYQIGDWYLRAFYATKHLVPLLEAMYHSVQAMIHAPYYQSRNSIDGKKLVQRALLYWSGLCQLRRLIKIGKGTLALWAPGMDVVNLYMAENITGPNGELAGRENIITESLQTLKSLFLKNSSSATDSAVSSVPEVPKIKLRIEEDVERVLYELRELNSSCLMEGKVHGGNLLPQWCLGTSVRPEGEIAASQDASQIANFQPLNIDQKIEKVGAFQTGVKFSEAPPATWADDIIEKIVETGYAVFGDGKKSMEIACENIGNVILGTDKSPVSLWAEWRASWLVEKWAVSKADDGSAYKLLWLLHELMYRIVRRAKLEFIVRQSQKADGTSSSGDLSPRERSFWLNVCAIAHTGINLFRVLSSDRLEDGSLLRVKILNLYGTALGYLGRNSEANRRFNEAHALVLSALRKTDGKELARVHIRRAEVYLREAYGFVKSPKKPAIDTRKFYSKIDMVWAALERGEGCLSGVSHSSFWWFRLTAVKLACYAAIARCEGGEGIDPVSRYSSMPTARYCLPFRRRQDFMSVLVSLLRDGLLLGDGDNFRQYRIIDYAIVADALCNRKVFGSAPADGLPLESTNEPHIAKHQTLLKSICHLFINHVAPSTEDDALGVYRESLRNKLRTTTGMGKYLDTTLT